MTLQERILEALGDRPVNEKAVPARTITFSPRLIACLISAQTAAAHRAELLSEQLIEAREKLADIEEIVRIATQRGAG